MVMSWTDPEGQPVAPITEDMLPGFTRSVIEITAAPPTVGSYNSITYFSIPSLPTSAQNAPSYVYNWTSDEVTVQCKHNL